MPEATQLVPLDAEEQWRDPQIYQAVSKAELSHPAEETHFGPLVSAKLVLSVTMHSLDENEANDAGLPG